MPGPRKNLREETGRLISAALWNKQHEPSYRGGDARSDAILDQQRAGPIERVEDKPIAVEDLPLEGEKRARPIPHMAVEDLPVERGAPLPPPAPAADTAPEAPEPQYPPAQTVAAPTDEEAADNLHETAREAMHAGDSATAAKLFKAAYAADPGLGSLAGAARAEEAQGNLDESLRLYIELLNRSLGSGDVARQDAARKGIIYITSMQTSVRRGGDQRYYRPAEYKVTGTGEK